jgi:hypothetical protein
MAMIGKPEGIIAKKESISIHVVRSDLHDYIHKIAKDEIGPHPYQLYELESRPENYSKLCDDYWNKVHEFEIMIKNRIPETFSKAKRYKKGLK